MAGDRALLDTGVLVAFLHRDDADHQRSVRAIRDARGPLVTTEAVLTESMYLLEATHGGTAACLEFFLRDGALLVPSSRAALARCRRLMETCADQPADYTDATLVALAEETDTWKVFTLDREDFSVYRGPDGQAFEILP